MSEESDNEPRENNEEEDVTKKGEQAAIKMSSKRVPYVFDAEFILSKIWPDQIHKKPIPKKGVKHKREDSNNSNDSSNDNKNNGNNNSGSNKYVKNKKRLRHQNENESSSSTASSTSTAATTSTAASSSSSTTSSSSSTTSTSGQKLNKRQRRQQQRKQQEQEQADSSLQSANIQLQIQQQQSQSQEQYHEQQQSQQQYTFIKPTRIFDCTKGLIVASVKGIQRIIADHLLPTEEEEEEAGEEEEEEEEKEREEEKGEKEGKQKKKLNRTNELELQIDLLQRFLFSLGYEFTHTQTKQAIEDCEKLHDLFITLDARSRKVLRRSDYVIGGDSVSNTSLSSACMETVREFNGRTARTWFQEAKNPFEHMRFTHQPSVLFDCKRQICSGCNKSAHLYCCRCLRACIPPSLLPPPVQLPVKFDVIHHPQENINKSTSIHACVLSPQSCSLFSFPDQVPVYSASDTVLLYPTEDAVFLKDLEPSFIQNLTRIVVIESTWQKGAVVAAHPHLQSLRKIKLGDWESTFWRYQELGRQYLSTLEAIYYTSIEFYNATCSSSSLEPSLTTTQSSSLPPAFGAYKGQFDDLLYFYVHNHEIINRRVENTDQKRIPPRSWKPLHVLPESDASKG